MTLINDWGNSLPAWASAWVGPLIACQSVSPRHNWQLDEAGVPSDMMAQWGRDKGKGGQEIMMDWRKKKKAQLRKKVPLHLKWSLSENSCKESYFILATTRNWNQKEEVEGKWPDSRMKWWWEGQDLTTGEKKCMTLESYYFDFHFTDTVPVLPGCECPCVLTWVCSKLDRQWLNSSPLWRNTRRLNVHWV